jgi:hypothetical protein
MKRYLHFSRILTWLFVLISLIFLIPFPLVTAQKTQKGTHQAPGKSAIKEASKELIEEALSVTRHSIEVNGGVSPSVFV